MYLIVSSLTRYDQYRTHKIDGENYGITAMTEGAR